MEKFITSARRPELPLNINILYHDFPTIHNHDYWEFLIILSGKYEHKINGLKETLERGQCYIIRPDDMHGLRQITDSASHLNIMVSREKFKDCAFNYGEKFYNFLLNAKTLKLNLNFVNITSLEQYALVVNDTEDMNLYNAATMYLINSLLNHAIDQLYSIFSDKPSWLVELITQIYRQENSAWTVNDILNHTSYSHTHLIRTFKKYFGCSIVDYLRKVKISFATDYLKHTSYNISEISTILGFTSVSHLNHIFKEATGKSPLQFRKDYLSNKNNKYGSI